MIYNYANFMPIQALLKDITKIFMESRLMSDRENAVTFVKNLLVDPVSFSTICTSNERISYFMTFHKVKTC